MNNKSSVVVADQERKLPRPGMMEWRNRIVLMLSTLVVSFGVGEWSLRFADIIDPPVFERHPSYGYLMKPNQSVSPRGHRFQINNIGFRGVDVGLRKPAQVFRVAFLGDSITYGGGEIFDDDLFVNQVVKQIPLQFHVDADALNLAAPGWGIANMAAYVTEKGLYGSNALIWVISSADFRRPKMTLEENGFWETKPTSRLLYGASIMLRRAYSEGLKGLSQHNLAQAHNESRVLEKNLALCRTMLSALKEKSVSVYVVLVPDAEGDRLEDEDFERYLAVADSIGVPVLDLRPAFRKHGASALFFDGVHLSAEGHRVVAKEIISFLTAHGLGTAIEAAGSRVEQRRLQ